ncbi:hypothetical protein VSS37_05215 [Candidatus Thiothrix sp. Deng01]|uniref:Sulfur globule protein CV1 n=1 Tax=Candidatus Thiothrix phosphatis TaxID=3112415 RepID=A0ABU6CU53_9GAMM|nr:hypothetical protein [Candidatus Thiothrix sp. Deng01]MEB4590370.1 hypothetical protein [Candidatus Thiothrix sp. Deng01]
MKHPAMIFALLFSAAGNASADWFDFFDMGDFFGNTRQGQDHRAIGNTQGQGNAVGQSEGRSHGRGAADINMDFDLNFRAKGWGGADAQSKGRSGGNAAQAQYLASQYNAWGTGYNNLHTYTFPDANAINAATAYGAAYPYAYSYPSYNYYAYTPYVQQGYQPAYAYPLYYPYYTQPYYGFSPVPAGGAGR